MIVIDYLITTLLQPFTYHFAYGRSTEQALNLQADYLTRPKFSISQEWQALGPFGIGTREAVWGGDPLEAHGGFQSLKYDPKATFPSALGEGGVCRWVKVIASDSAATDEFAKASLQFGFPDTDWAFLRSIYGWSSLQYQAWVRGNLTIDDTEGAVLAIYTDGILEFRIDGELHFGGDFYSYRRAPLILELGPGVHSIETRLFYDIRALGGGSIPQLNSTVEFRQIPKQMNIVPTSILVADILNDKLSSPYLSLNVQNGMERTARIKFAKYISENKSAATLQLLNGPVAVGPHQHRPVAFALRFQGSAPDRFILQIGYEVDTVGSTQTAEVIVALKRRSVSEAQKFTFLHPSGIVSYAVLRPPLNASCATNKNPALPLLLGLHGAGLEADGEIVTHMLDGVYGICAWILFPTGVTPWSGDDWHTWGFTDVQAAIAAIPDWMKAVGWDGAGLLEDERIIVGHSNGGQGTWYLLSHQPDKIKAAAPVSGYTSIENYVPFHQWKNANPFLAAVLDSSRSNFKNERLVENFANVPVFQQHGAEDGNVPAYHSRLMHQLTWENGHVTQYHEIPGAGHWFDGVLTTPYLVNFYHQYVENNQTKSLSEFSFSIPSSADMGSKGGIFVDQLFSPDKYGHMSVVRDSTENTWHITTRNIRRFHFVPGKYTQHHPTKISLEGLDFVFLPPKGEDIRTWYVRNATGHWELTQDIRWRNISERYGRQVGTMDAILRSNGTLTIFSHSLESYVVALQVSRNLFQYYGADSELITANSTAVPRARSGNLITVTLARHLPQTETPDFPILVKDGHLTINRSGGLPAVRYKPEPGLGAIFIQPLPNERLELVIWGVDQDGLQQAARFVPTLTGVGQPDFIIVSSRCRWKGAGGVYAAGFFDYSWQISSGSYVS